MHLVVGLASHPAVMMVVTWNFGFFLATWNPQKNLKVVVTDRGHELVGPQRGVDVH